MASKAPLFPWLLLLLSSSALLISCTSSIPQGDEEQVYIVYMGDLPKGDVSPASLHANMLQKVRGSRAADSLIHSYKKSFNGFVAKLSKDEAERLKSMEGVVSVFLNRKKELFTTRSWDFMGFPQQVNRTVVESDVIVGMFDTGVWPESESFNDAGFGPAPAKWKGTCQASSDFTCNNKIIGARVYHSGGKITDPDHPSPRDSEGHGTHTASIAAGGLAAGASMLGVAAGTARGGVPSARIAVYKACWASGCPDADILAAFDDAIADGVDVISLSMGGRGGVFDYFYDSISIGSFHAMRKGILTSNAAGNGGPALGSISNVAPWSLSVAASTIDRSFVTKLTLGNNASYEGISLNVFDMEGMYPLIHGADAPNVGLNSPDSRSCIRGTLNTTLVKGKILVCDDVVIQEAGQFQAGAAGTVMLGGLNVTDVDLSFPLPATWILRTSAEKQIMQYLNTTRKPTARISKSTEVKRLNAPFVASFSSRGPSEMTSDILKPDLAAPGLDILAAWPEGASPTYFPKDTRVVKYKIATGTSMACAHATGIAAYVKSFHPTWSPAAIKSALMTTAFPMTSKTNPDAEFAYGSGHLNPTRAVDPGLVYDAGEIDYVKFLCGQGYSTEQLRLLTGDDSSCSKTDNGTVWDLNYPSFTLSTPLPNTNVTRVFHRTVTNVGTAVSTYRAKVFQKKPGLSISVEPSVLNFKSVGQKLSFVVTVQAAMGSGEIISGALEWNDGVHRVKSPVVAYVTVDHD